MSFREFSHRFLERGAMWTMILGIIFLCQPWLGGLHAYSVTIMIVGLVGFLVAVHVPPPDRAVGKEDSGPASLSDLNGEGPQNG